MGRAISRRARAALVVLVAALAVVLVPGVAKADVPEWAKGNTFLKQSFADDFLDDEEHGQVYMSRLYNPYTGEHFYTANKGEKDSLVEVGWRYEGMGWIAPTSGTPVYRLYNKYVPGGDHHYTTSEEERDACIAAGWSDEGIGWYSADEKTGQPLLRQYNPYADTGTHNYTTSQEENDHLVSVGWEGEGVGWYGVKPTAPADLEFFDRYASVAYYQSYDVMLDYCLFGGYSLSESVAGLPLALEGNSDFIDFWNESAEYYAFAISDMYTYDKDFDVDWDNMDDAEAMAFIQSKGGPTDAQLTVYLQQAGFSYDQSVEGVARTHE